MSDDVDMETAQEQEEVVMDTEEKEDAGEEEEAQGDEEEEEAQSKKVEKKKAKVPPLIAPNNNSKGSSITPAKKVGTSLLATSVAKKGGPLVGTAKPSGKPIVTGGSKPTKPKSALVMFQNERSKDKKGKEAKEAKAEAKEEWGGMEDDDPIKKKFNDMAKSAKTKYDDALKKYTAANPNWKKEEAEAKALKNGSKEEKGSKAKGTKAAPKARGGGKRKNDDEDKVKFTPKYDDAPKKAPTSNYMAFVASRRSELTSQGLSLTEVAKAAGAEWKALSDADKAEWKDKVTQAKAKYEQELQAYLKKHPDEQEEYANAKPSGGKGSRGKKKGGDDDEPASKRPSRSRKVMNYAEADVGSGEEIEESPETPETVVGDPDVIEA